MIGLGKKINNDQFVGNIFAIMSKVIESSATMPWPGVDAVVR